MITCWYDVLLQQSMILRSWIVIVTTRNRGVRDDPRRSCTVTAVVKTGTSVRLSVLFFCVWSCRVLLDDLDPHICLLAVHRRRGSMMQHRNRYYFWKYSSLPPFALKLIGLLVSVVVLAATSCVDWVLSVSWSCMWTRDTPRTHARVALILPMIYVVRIYTILESWPCVATSLHHN
jgi:hypothetical protein